MLASPPFFVLALKPALLAIGISSVGSAALVSYNFASNSQAGSGIDSNITASPFSAGAGLTATYTSDHARSAGAVGTSAIPGTEATSVSENDYFTFTVTPTAGYQLNLTSLSFSVQYYGAVSATAWAKYFVRSSRDGFASTIGATFETTLVAASYSAGNWVPNNSISLTGPLFQNVTEETVFRIYLYDNNSTDRWIALDSIVVDGSALAIPEPASFLMAGMAACGILLTRKRRPL